MIDTHCHLADPAFDADREAVYDRAWAAGLTALVEIADAETGWAKARALSEHPSGRVWWSAGLHPYVADTFDAGTPARLIEALRHPRAVAVGEIGLDYYKHCQVPRDVQKVAFAALAQAGLSAGKPLVLHCREADATSTDAQTDMLTILETILTGPQPPASSLAIKGVAHCFQGTIENARRFIDLGFMIGVDAPVTYPKAETLRGLVRALPLDSLVLETDSPYLPPQDKRGQRNEPSYVSAVATAVSLIKGASLQEVESKTDANAVRLYGASLKKKQR